MTTPNDVAREPHAAHEPFLRGEVAFRLLVDAVQDYAIFLLSTEGRVLTWNRGAQRIKGYSADEIIGEHFSVFYTPDEQKAGRPMSLLGWAAERGRFEDEGWRVRKDGTWFWADVIVTALRDEAGVPYAFAKITRDLTERRASEERQASCSLKSAHAPRPRRRSGARSVPEHRLARAEDPDRQPPPLGRVARACEGVRQPRRGPAGGRPRPDPHGVPAPGRARRRAARHLAPHRRRPADRPRSPPTWWPSQSEVIARFADAGAGGPDPAHRPGARRSSRPMPRVSTRC